MIEGLGSTLNRPGVRILSADQCQVIHSTALDILWRTGVKVGHPEAVDMLSAAGCRVDEDSTVRIPAGMVDEALLRAPRRVTIFDRTGNRAMHLEGANTYFGTHIGYPVIWDHQTGHRRPFCLADAVDLARLTDALPYIDFIVTSGIASDVPRHQTACVIFREVVKNTIKPIVFCATTDETFEAGLEMARQLVGGAENLRRRPFILHYSEPISPLQHSHDGLARLLACAETGIPLVYTPMLMLGATAPATEAGLLAVCVAEELSGLVIAQLKQSGAPFIFGGITTTMDMGTQICSYGAPELNRMCAALTDMAHHYELPMFGTAGCSDSKLCDGQAVIEMSLSLAASFLSGANLIHDVGLMEFANAASFEALVIADQIIELVRASWRPIETNEETLAVDLIDRVGSGGHFLTEDHTLRRFRDVLYSPLLDRRRHEAWAADGEHSFEHRIKEKVGKILAEYKPEPLDEEVRRRLDEVALPTGK